MNPSRARELALLLTSWPSVTDSDGETRFASLLRDYLAAWPYFAARPDGLRLVRTLDDARERYALVAIVGGDTRGDDAGGPRPAVILTGHYDVVSTEAYGALEPWAFDPVGLRPRLVAALEAEAAAASARGESPSDAEKRALRDLRSGDFLPGRGLLDMKAGLAAGLAVLEDYASRLEGCAERPEGERSVDSGALIFLAVPDEEGASYGMRSAVRALPCILAERRLEAVAAINLDAAVDQGDGAEARAVFMGSVGKLHPFAYLVGRPTHAGAPFDGINPALLAAELVRRLECAPGILDAARDASGDALPGDAPPPPTVLYYRELRDRYDVTTPSGVFVSLNALTHRDGPAAVLAAVSGLAARAMDEALSTLRRRAEAYGAASGQRFSVPGRAPRVVAWAELASAARAAARAAFDEAVARARDASDGMGALAALVEAAARLASLEGPAAVVGLAPPYYPRAALRSGDAWVEAAVSEALAGLAPPAGLAGGAAGATVKRKPFFPGISDMSYVYPLDGDEERRLAAEACPVGLDALPGGFSCPIVNLGPWGREYHQRLERVHEAYAFSALPEAVGRLAFSLLGKRPTGPRA